MKKIIFFFLKKEVISKEGSSFYLLKLMEKMKKRDRDSIVFKDWFVCIDIERERDDRDLNDRTGRY